MMAVDNGFEDQWRDRDPRLVNTAGDLVTPLALGERYASEGSGSWPATSIDTTADLLGSVTPWVLPGIVRLI